VSLLTVVQDVCATVGVERPAAVFAGINANRTLQEMLALANEVVQRIAWDTREWTTLSKQAMLTGDGVSEAFNLPADFKRMLLTTNVWRSTSTMAPMRFVPDTDQWFQHRAWGYADPRGEWTMYGGQIHIQPVMAGPIPGPAVTARFPYLEKNCIALASGGVGDAFLQDGDIFRIDERTFKLGMIWAWKQLKGSPYAEDMANYQDALNRVSGADKPAPIILGRLPISASVGASYPFPIDPNMVPL
jgi:hypothetical protein